MFKPVCPEINFSQLDTSIIDFWKKEKIFEKSIESKQKDKIYSFYDGPPFITGLPHYGSLLSSIAKDVVLRFQTMKGYKIRRVWGWDCHGLPAETAVEKILGLKCKRDIERLGIDNFVEQCRVFVSKTSSEWEWYIDHIGRWVDFKNAYKTMDIKYMETVLWVFKELHKKDLIYKGKRVSLFCPRCSTPLSKFEITMDEGSYREITDPAITIKFKIKGEVNKYILAWTTTPWTLPSNFALAVDPKQNYLEVKSNEEVYIIAQKRYKDYFSKEKIVRKLKGKEIIGWEYEPLFNFFSVSKNDFKVYPADFVTMTDGTGVVHIAPGFGEDDTLLGEKVGLSMADSVDEEGRLVEKVKPWAGVFIKDADPGVISDLKERNLLFKEEKITHSYPFCYRCDSPLLYKAQEAWYVRIDKIREQLIKTNKNIYWFPKHFKKGRFENNLKIAPEWCISRTRYWGTPLPVWECECKERYVFGSIKEIEEASGQKVTDLHRPEIDQITVNCKCGKRAYRVRDVLDCWMESGSMPYGEWHYPFENVEKFKHGFPSDFITEYTGQLRAWFYYLHVLSNALFGTNSFKNAVVTGVILGNDGKKMSKSKGNFPDPKEILSKYGGDALRLFLMNSQVISGGDIIVSEEGVANQVKNVILPLWNSYRYFITFADLHNWSFNTSIVNYNILDKWIESQLFSFGKKFTRYFDNYNIQKAVELTGVFMDDLSRWYIRRSRERFVEGDLAALNTLYKVLTLFLKIIAPVVPFVSEEMYKNLTGNLSVHLQDWPKIENKKIDIKLQEAMALVRLICELGLAKRKELEIKVRQPLSKLKVQSSKFKVDKELIDLIKNELNVKEVVIEPGEGEMGVELDTNITQELKEEGEARDIIRQIQEARKELGCKLKDKVSVGLSSWPRNFEEEIKKRTLSIELYQAEKLEIEIITG